MFLIFHHYCFSKSWGKRGVATCAGLTSWRNKIIILCISLIITSFEVLIKTEIDLSGDLCGWASLFRESNAHLVNSEDARKGAWNSICLTKLVRLLRLTAVHSSRNKPNRIQSKTYAKERYKINICCWNIRNLLGLASSKRREWRTASVNRIRQTEHRQRLYQRHVCQKKINLLKKALDTPFSGLENRMIRSRRVVLALS